MTTTELSHTADRAALEIRFGGACRVKDPIYGYDLHFPVAETSAHAEQIARAKAVCSTCPVLAKCVLVAMTQADGIWAGMTETERRGIRAQEKKLELAAAQADRPGAVDAPTTAKPTHRRRVRNTPEQREYQAARNQLARARTRLKAVGNEDTAAVAAAKSEVTTAVRRVDDAKAAMSRARDIDQAGDQFANTVEAVA